MHRNISAREKFFLALTGSRIVLAFGLAHSIGRSFNQSLVWLAAIILADIFDGVLARRFACDSNRRRICDAAVDRISIWIAFWPALRGHPQLWLLYVPLMLRGLILSSGSVMCWWRRRTIVLGGRWHKAATLSLAAFGIAVLSNDIVWIWLTVVPAWIINWVLLADYLGIQRVVWRGSAWPESSSLKRITVRKLSGLKLLMSFSSAKITV